MYVYMYVCKNVVHLAKCCIIAAVYICMYVVHLAKCCIIAVVYLCMYVYMWWFIWISVALLQLCMYLCGSSG